MACLQHEEVQHFLPTCGWGSWAGEPTRGFDKRQPGNWTYNLLPYLELQNLHDLGIREGIDATAVRPGFTQRVSTPVTTLICPTRRTVVAFPFLNTAGGMVYGNIYPNLNPTPIVCGRSDYAASVGDAAAQLPPLVPAAWRTAMP